MSYCIILSPSSYVPLGTSKTLFECLFKKIKVYCMRLLSSTGSNLNIWSSIEALKGPYFKNLLKYRLLLASDAFLIQ
jgi:hypothetical protein